MLSYVCLCDPMDYTPWNSPGQNTGVSSLFLLQGIFPTQESNWGVLHCRRILYQLSYQGSPIYKCVYVYIYTLNPTYTHTHTHIYIYTHTHIYMYIYFMYISQRQYMWNFFFNDTNELIYKTEIDPQTQKTNLWLPKGKGEEG